MRKDKSAATITQEQVGRTIEDIIREGAKALIQKAIESELAEMLETFDQTKMISGQKMVVRNGYQPSRNILTGIGPVEVSVPKVRDRSQSGIKFNSRIVPPYVRKSGRVSAALPWLYLKGISTGAMKEALLALVGDDAKGLSANTVSRLKAEWSDEYSDWMKRDLSDSKYVYWWVDGIHTSLREIEDNRMCLLVIVGVTLEGDKEPVTISDGFRESSESWKDVLRDLKARGLKAGPMLAIGDGAMGFWSALDEIYPGTRHQRCWVHKTANVLNALPKSQQAKAKSALQEIWMAATRDDAYKAFDNFIETYGARYPKAADKLEKDRESLMAFYDFPADHWVHIRTTNPIESTFATVRHRTTRTKNCVTRTTFLVLAYKLVREAEKSWQKIRKAFLLKELMKGVIFKDGLPVHKPDTGTAEQRLAA